MTREEFLAGKKFRIKNNGYLRYVAPEKEGEKGHINQYIFFHCVVDSVGPTAFHWFTSVMNKRVSGCTPYEKCELIND